MRWTGISDAVDALKRKAVSVEHATAEGVRRGITIVQEAAQANTLTVFRQWTGALSESIIVDGPMQIGASSYRARTYPTIVYGRIQELGGTILPHNPSGRLWWEGIRSDGSFGLISAKEITLPPRPYLTPALETSIPAMRDAISGAWEQALGA